MAKKSNNPKTVEALKHDEATRKNIPTAEYQSVLQKNEQSPVRLAYERRNRDLDPQLVWRGKDEQDWSDLVVHAPPLYIQETAAENSDLEEVYNTERHLLYVACTRARDQLLVTSVEPASEFLDDLKAG